jgi:hypothetical protein
MYIINYMLMYGIMYGIFYRDNITTICESNSMILNDNFIINVKHNLWKQLSSTVTDQVWIPYWDLIMREVLDPTRHVVNDILRDNLCIDII